MCVCTFWLSVVKNQERAAGDGAVEGAAAAAEVVKQRPLSREEQEHAMKIDNIIASVLRKVELGEDAY